MRKTLLIILLSLLTLTITAQTYRESFGVVLGTIDGISYKCYAKNTQHFAFQFDAFWQWGYMPSGTRYDYSITGNNVAYSEQTYISNFSSTQYQAAMTAFSFMYQGQFHSTAKGAWNWYAGGGFGLGFSWGDRLDDIAAEFNHSYKEFLPWLKFDEHAIVGVEYCFARTPLVLGIDFRPALAENMQFKGIEHNRDDIYLLSFDWGVNMTVRYYFTKDKKKGSE